MEKEKQYQITLRRKEIEYILDLLRFLHTMYGNFTPTHFRFVSDLDTEELTDKIFVQTHVEGEWL